MMMSGCDAQRICPDVLLPAVVVEVVDADTGEYIAGDASGYIQDRGYADALVPHASTIDGVLMSLQGGLGRPGTYTVFVEVPGYQRWEREEVRVETQLCGVRPTELTAEMVRS